MNELIETIEDLGEVLKSLLTDWRTPFTNVCGLVSILGCLGIVGCIAYAIISNTILLCLSAFS